MQGRLSPTLFSKFWRKDSPPRIRQTQTESTVSLIVIGIKKPSLIGQKLHVRLTL